MCSYCGCRSIEVIGRYSREHDECINLLGDLRRRVADGDEGEVSKAVDALTAVLDPHTLSEERSLFAELRLDDEFTDHVDSLCGEHRTLEEQMTAIAGGDLAQFPTFELALRQHIDREENGLFPAAAIALDGPAWDRVHDRA